VVVLRNWLDFEQQAKDSTFNLIEQNVTHDVPTIEIANTCGTIMDQL
jgi:hypothetical protein